MKRFFLGISLLLLTLKVSGQEKIGNQWFDNNLTFWIEYDQIATERSFYYCIADSVRGECIENLLSGFTVKAYNKNDKLVWEGFGSGRRRGVKIPEGVNNIHYIVMEAFKPWVTNSLTGTRIHQDEPIKIKYQVK